MIAVLGSGAFGTALAIAFATQGRDVMLWTRSADHAAQMQRDAENRKRLPGAAFPKTLRPTADLGSIPAEIPIFLSVPMQQLRSFLTENTALLAKRPVVACCKGVDLATGQGPTTLINQIVPEACAAILTGPSFASDIAVGLPTALTLACADVDQGKALQTALRAPTLRIYRSTDTTGAELGGALKNVIAIASGAVMGAGLGESARAALMTRGYAEMQRMALRLGAKPETLAGLSGFGDLTLTCTSQQSRNYRFGQALGRGEAFDASITVEGAATARAVLERAKSMQLDMPITEAVVALLDQKVDVADAMQMLLSRPPKEE